MGHETFTCQGRVWTRRTFDGIPATILENHGSVTWTGIHILSDGNAERIVERSTVTEAETGTSLVFSGTFRFPDISSLSPALEGLGWKEKIK